VTRDSKRRRRRASRGVLTARAVIDRLLPLHGPVEVPHQLDPVGELVLTILSQNTSDANSFRAYESLVKRFGDWDRLRRARVGSIAAAIRPAGLADQKAPRIKQVLGELYREQGRTTLDQLATMTDAEAKAYLIAFHGVGPKTAACVLLFACGRPVLPVDTHVHRVAGRLGMIDARTNADKAHDLLQAQLAPEQVLDFHVLLIRHGRRTCRAIRPRCDGCALLDVCVSGPGLLASGQAAAPDGPAPDPPAATVSLPHVPPSNPRRPHDAQRTSTRRGRK